MGFDLALGERGAALEGVVDEGGELLHGRVRPVIGGRATKITALGGAPA
jgi:hypothetical protein